MKPLFKDELLHLNKHAVNNVDFYLLEDGTICYGINAYDTHALADITNIDNLYHRADIEGILGYPMPKDFERVGVAVQTPRFSVFNTQEINHKPETTFSTGERLVNLRTGNLESFVINRCYNTLVYFRVSDGKREIRDAEIIITDNGEYFVDEQDSFIAGSILYHK